MNKITSIPFLEIESIPQLIKDFLTQKIPGFEEKIFDLKNIKEQFEEKAQSFSSESRKTLVEVIAAQYHDFQLTSEQRENLQDLNLKSTFTVTTGHQLNLFTGPVFFIYKILQTIKLAKFLQEHFPENHFVPIFWLASEDHDFEEINHFKTEDNFYEIKAKSGGAVGKILVEDDFFISQFEEEFEDAVFGTELILILKRAYKKGNSLAEATRTIVQELFAEFGLLVIDGDNRHLKEQMTEIFKDELLHQALVSSTAEKVAFLSEKYGKVQVNPREINLFYLSETRDRIAFEDHKYIIVDRNQSFTESELITELHDFPERFSPNALLRPVYQEMVLPNIAYIGGNAEIMYWLELKDYYEKINLPFPILIPRRSMLMVREKTLNKAEKLGLTLPDFFKNFAEITKDIILDNHEILKLLEDQRVLLDRHFELLKSKAALTDPTFENLVDAEKTRQLKSFDRMEKRLLRAEKIKQNEKITRLQDLFLRVHPGNAWQERSYNFSVFYAQYGKEWLYNCYEGIQVKESELIIYSV